MKAIEKDRSRRYETAAAFAADVERHLRNEPVEAGPPGVLYRVRKFVRRHRVGVVTGCAIALALLSGLALATVGFLQADRARADLEDERDAADAARLNEEAARKRAQESARQARAEAEKAKAATTFLQEMLAGIHGNRRSRKEVSVLTVINEAVERLDKGALADQPEVESVVRCTLSWTYVSLWRYDLAEAELRKSEAAALRAKGPDSKLTLDARNWLAAVLERQGRCREAERLARDTLARAEQVLGPDHPRTLYIMTVLAMCLYRRSEFAGAEAMLRKAAQGERRILGEEHYQTLVTLSGLALVLSGLGRYAESEAIHRRVLRVRRRVLGEANMQTLNSMRNLAEVLMRQRRLEEAEEVLREALEKQRNTYGEMHPDTATTLNNLAMVLRLEGDLAQSRELQEKSLEINRQLLGVNHPNVRMAIANLVIVLRRMGDREAIRDLTEDDLADYADAAERPDVDANTLHAYARQLLECRPAILRDPESAIPVARRAARMTEGKNAAFLDTLGMALRLTARNDAAVRAMGRAVSVDSPGRSGKPSRFERKLLDWMFKDRGVLGVWQALGDILVARARKPAGGEAGSVPGR